MLFMVTSASEPGKSKEFTDKVMERQSSNLFPEGIKVIGSWVSVGSGKAFTVCEANDVKALVEATFPWRGLRTFEIVPLIQAEELLKMAGSIK